MVLHWLLLNPLYGTALVVVEKHCGLLAGVPMEQAGVSKRTEVHMERKELADILAGMWAWCAGPSGSFRPWAACSSPLASGPVLPYIPKAKVTAMVTREKVSRKTSLQVGMDL